MESENPGLIKQSKYLIVICGPTAVGKTHNSIELAKYFNTEIISADARQLFKEISIGTAKPDPEELKAVKHHFINHVSITEKFNAGIYEQQALKLVEDIFETQDVVIVCGGSGLYIKALCEGLDELPGSDENLRAELKDLYSREGIEALQMRLKNMDALHYEKTDVQNPQRLMRAIEISTLGGGIFHQLKKIPKKERNFHIIQIGFEMKREDLYDRINRRVDLMLEEGLLEEAQNLHHLKNLNALQTVGYSELFKYLDGEIRYEESIRLIKQHTRNYAKRQLTWFKKIKDITWFHPSETEKVKAFLIRKMEL